MVTVEITAFWVVIPNNVVDVYRKFKGMFHLHLHGITSQKT
jgi:hypothetical protein